MDTPSEYPSLGDILHASTGLLATKYLAGLWRSSLPSYMVLTSIHPAAALVCALYDHALMFDDELTVIWRKGGINIAKIVYICVRYGTNVSLIYVAYSMFQLKLRPSERHSDAKISVQSSPDFGPLWMIK